MRRSCTPAARSEAAADRRAHHGGVEQSGADLHGHLVGRRPGPRSSTGSRMLTVTGLYRRGPRP